MLKKWARKLLGWMVAALFFVSMVLAAIPHMIWVTGQSVVKRESRSQLRARLMHWRFSWGNRYFTLVKTILGVSLRHELVEINCDSNYIVIANHRSFMDHLVVNEVLQMVRAPRSLWVVKEEIRFVPFFGWMLDMIGCAYVARSTRPSWKVKVLRAGARFVEWISFGRYRILPKGTDVERLGRMAGIAFQESASVMIYPEGTRFSGVPKQGARFTRVREVKLTGFKTLCDELPDHRILVVIIDWGDMEGGKNIWDGNAFAGRHAGTTIMESANPGSDHAEAFLDSVWSHMEQKLSSGSQPSREWVSTVGR